MIIEVAAAVMAISLAVGAIAAIIAALAIRSAARELAYYAASAPEDVIAEADDTTGYDYLTLAAEEATESITPDDEEDTNAQANGRLRLYFRRKPPPEE